MKKIKRGNLEGGQSIHLAKDHVLSFEAQTLQIHCFQGLIWVTWPDGNERVLKKGQAIQVVSNGMTCIQAFTAGSVIVTKPKMRHFFSILGSYRRHANKFGVLLNCSRVS